MSCSKRWLRLLSSTYPSPKYELFRGQMMSYLIMMNPPLTLWPGLVPCVAGQVVIA